MPQQASWFDRVVRRLANHGGWLLAALVADIFATAILFSQIEHIPLLKSVYWSVVTGYTIGYGDVLPTHNTSYGLTVFTIISLHFLILLVSAKVITSLVTDRDKFTHEEQEALKAQLLKTQQQLEKSEQRLGEVDEKLQTLVGNMLTEQEQKEMFTILKQIKDRFPATP